MGSQRKILENTEEISSLLSLRDELYRNTVKIIDLVKDRIRLAEEIGREKNILGLSLRNHDREMEVIGSIPDLGEIEKSVLNMIFELTILNEMKDKPRINLKGFRDQDAGDIVLSGPNDILSYSMGLIVSFPGFQLRDRIGIPENLAIGVAQRGGHITNSMKPTESGEISLVNGDGTLMATLSNEMLRISFDIFSHNSRNEYMEAV